MNATARTFPPANPRPGSARRFVTLLRREYWEHRGGFLWAPVIAGTVSLLLTTGLLAVTVIGLRKAESDAGIVLDDGSRMMLNGLDLGRLAGQMNAQEMAQLAGGINLTMMLASLWPYIVMVFVMFFYCLGALYDERKDRSVLFWKSLPVSDGATVLSKVVSAVITLPLLATLAAIATMFAFLLVLSVFVLLHGGNPIDWIWGPGNPLWNSMAVLVAIPVYALWALPTVGWLMLCSAWARSMPFLWALLVPVLAGVFVAMVDVMGMVGRDASWFWNNIVARMLLGVMPITHHDIARIGGSEVTNQSALQLIDPSGMYSNLVHADVWIGAIAGVVLLLVAVRLRRWRDEG